MSENLRPIVPQRLNGNRRLTGRRRRHLRPPDARCEERPDWEHPVDRAFRWIGADRRSSRMKMLLRDGDRPLGHRPLPWAGQAASAELGSRTGLGRTTGLVLRVGLVEPIGRIDRTTWRGHRPSPGWSGVAAGHPS